MTQSIPQPGQFPPPAAPAPHDARQLAGNQRDEAADAGACLGGGRSVLRRVRCGAVSYTHLWRNAQPTLGPTPTGTLALAHNGNLTNTVELRALAVEIADDGEDFERGASTDTSLVTALLGMADRLPGPTPFIASPSVTPSETDGDEAAPASSITCLLYTSHNGVQQS